MIASDGYTHHLRGTTVDTILIDTCGSIADHLAPVCYQYMLQMELLHETRGAAENEHYFKPLAAHLGVDSNARGRGVRTIYVRDTGM